MNIQDVYRRLQELGLVRSQMEFSRLWLGKSSRYYSSMLARQQQPSLGTLTALLFRLRNVLDHTSEGGLRSAIFTLVQQIEKYVALRVVAGGALRRLPTTIGSNNADSQNALRSRSARVGKVINHGAAAVVVAGVDHR